MKSVVERINDAHLKPYQVANESSEVRNTVEKGKVCNIDLDKQQSEEIEVDKLDHNIVMGAVVFIKPYAIVEDWCM